MKEFVKAASGRIIIVLLTTLIIISVFNQTHRKNRKIIFQGNSLFNTGVNHVTNGLRYMTTGIYNNLLSYGLSYVDYSVAGQDQTQINALIPTQFNSTTVNPGDIVVIWELTNDLAHDSALSGAAAYANLVTFCNAVKALGAKVVVSTAIARDLATDDAGLMSRIDAANALVRANWASFSDALFDFALVPGYTTRADAGVSPPYATDKLHLLQAGQDAGISGFTAKIITIL